MISTGKFIVIIIICVLIAAPFCAGRTLAEGNDLSIPFSRSDVLRSGSCLPDSLANLTSLFPRSPLEISSPDNSGDTALILDAPYQEVVSTGMSTLGNAVLLPVTPTPDGSGYSYYNPGGTDPSYLIYDSGNYTLSAGFSTTNYSAVRIRASDVSLDGNGKAIFGNLSGYGINIPPWVNRVTIHNFTGINSFYGGVASQGVENLITHNYITDNYGLGIYSNDSNTIIRDNILDNNTDVGVYSLAENATIRDNLISGNEYGVYSKNNNTVMKNNRLIDNYGGIYIPRTSNSIFITGNSINYNGWGVVCNGSNTNIYQNIICENNNNIYSTGPDAIISGNDASWGSLVNIWSSGSNALISGNKASYAGYDNIFSTSSNATITDNNVSYANNEMGFGIYSYADNVTISGNIADGSYLGILSGGSFTVITGNQASDTAAGIMISFGNDMVVSANAVRNSTKGLVIQGNNSLVSSNFIHNTSMGLSIDDDYGNVTVRGNKVINSSEYGIYIEKSTEEGGGDGFFFDNYLGNLNNTGGDGNMSRYHWTNPSGPERRTNVVGGPYTAGNFWSNPTRTGWSDQQPACVAGFTTTPYEVGSGVYDTAPLVSPILNIFINATADDWTIIVPHGNNSYQAYSNQTFITQAKPGSTLTEVLVNNSSFGAAPFWTFTNLNNDQTIQTVGNATSGQVHVFFNASPRNGTAPLSVDFHDNSIGDPTSWYWQFGDGATNVTPNPDHTYTVPGIYTVSLRAMNSYSGGSGTWNQFIKVAE